MAYKHFFYAFLRRVLSMRSSQIKIYDDVCLLQILSPTNFSLLHHHRIMREKVKSDSCFKTPETDTTSLIRGFQNTSH